MNLRLKSWDVFSRTAMSEDKQKFNDFMANFINSIRMRRDLLDAPA